MSERLKSALSKVPATNPSCTDNVNQLAAVGPTCHSRASAGTTAEPLNHSDMPKHSAIASSVSVRQRELSSPDLVGVCKREIVTQRPRQEPNIYSAVHLKKRWLIEKQKLIRFSMSQKNNSAFSINISRLRARESGSLVTTRPLRCRS